MELSGSRIGLVLTLSLALTNPLLAQDRRQHDPV